MFEIQLLALFVKNNWLLVLKLPSDTHKVSAALCAKVQHETTLHPSWNILSFLVRMAHCVH